MRHTFDLSFMELHDSEVFIKFVDSEFPTFLDFLVPVPDLNRSINTALKINSIYPSRISINGVSIPIRYSEIVNIKKHFDYLTK